MEDDESIKWGEVIWLGGGIGLFFGVPASLIICLFSASWGPFFPVLALAIIGGIASIWWTDTGNIEGARRVKQAKYLDGQKKLHLKARNLEERSKTLVKRLPTKLQDAETALNRAEVEFKEGAFAPFWDAIEQAVNSLAQFQEDARTVVKDSRNHRHCVQKIDQDPPKFSVTLDHLPEPTSITNRLQQIVREAQKDFQFATIYEQRKTNEILIAGFGNLANAITNMGDKISMSINDLSEVITTSQQETKESLDAINQTLLKDGERSASHDKEELEMLDNIQSHRKPIRPIPEPRDGNWDKS